MLCPTGPRLFDHYGEQEVLTVTFPASSAGAFCCSQVLGMGDLQRRQAQRQGGQSCWSDSVAGPTRAECRVGEPFTEWPLCPAFPDARPPPAAWICAHCTCLHPELHPGTIPGCEGIGRRALKVLASLSLVWVMGERHRLYLEDTWPHP